MNNRSSWLFTNRVIATYCRVSAFDNSLARWLMFTQKPLLLPCVGNNGAALHANVGFLTRNLFLVERHLAGKHRVKNEVVCPISFGLQENEYWTTSTDPK